MVLVNVARHDPGNPEIALYRSQVSFSPESNHELRAYLQAERAARFCVAPTAIDVLDSIPLAARDGSNSIFHRYASKWNVSENNAEIP